MLDLALLHIPDYSKSQSRLVYLSKQFRKLGCWYEHSCMPITFSNSAATLSIMALSITIFSITTLSIMTISIMTFSITTPSKTTFNKTTLNIMTFSI
jgi:hypothetical protein